LTFSVNIDPRRCRGHALCALLFSEGIELDHWGHGRVLESGPYGRAGIRRARRAAAACPNGAILIVESHIPAGQEPGGAGGPTGRRSSVDSS